MDVREAWTLDQSDNDDNDDDDENDAVEYRRPVIKLRYISMRFSNLAQNLNNLKKLIVFTSK